MFFLSLFLIGACFGSFLCLVAERLPVEIGRAHV